MRVVSHVIDLRLTRLGNRTRDELDGCLAEEVPACVSVQREQSAVARGMVSGRSHGQLRH